jgi:8-oxo-dGTP pyrophosphatase MutT (NUDIX family)
MQFVLFHQMLNRIVRKFQSLIGMQTIGARAIVINPQNQVLLVKHTYQPHWYTPGGGIQNGESIKAGLLRELKEEVGIIATGEVELFGIYHHTYLNVSDHPIIYIVKQYNQIESHSPEIESMQWFDYDYLPAMISPGTKRRLDEYFGKVKQSDRW